MTLTDADFGNAEVYRVNAARLRKRVDALDKEIAGRLAQLKTVPFLVLHDDYQYLEARYGLDAQGSIAIAATPLDTAALAEVAAKIAEVKAECVIGESAADEPALTAIAGAAKVRTRRVDIYTATAKNPADAFFAMLEHVADGFVQCLGGGAASQTP
jgi:zinc transport system substrate-binding protein